MVFCFVDTVSKINTNILIERTFSNDRRIAIPLCIGKGTMGARGIHSLAEPHSGMAGILEPAMDDTLVTPAEIDFTILPCVSCDRQGNCLSHEGGYHDRFLGQASFYSVLICQEYLLCEQIPAGPRDIVALVMITEVGCFSHE